MYMRRQYNVDFSLWELSSNTMASRRHRCRLTNRRLTRPISVKLCVIVLCNQKGVSDLTKIFLFVLGR